MKEIEQILGAIEKATGVKPTPFSTSMRYTLPAINYTLFRDSNDGVKSGYTLQLRIMDQNLTKSFQAEEAIQKAIVTVGDEPKFGCIVAQNGGGTLEDPGTGLPQIITYFDITVRSL